MRSRTPNAGPRVAVWVQSYNHAPWVRQAVESVLQQDYAGPLHLIVHDDASTDGTADALQAILRDVRIPTTTLFQPTNIHKTGKRALDYFPDHIDADIVMFCEGDDAWTRNDKVRRQVSAMSEAPEVDLSFHRASALDSSGAHLETVGDYGQAQHVVGFSELIRRVCGDVATASLAVRRPAFDAFLDFTRKRADLDVRDAYVKVFGARRGGALYVPMLAAIYRRGVQGSWTDSMQSKAAQVQHLLRRVRGVLAVRPHVSHPQFDSLTAELRSRSVDLALNGVDLRSIARDLEPDVAAFVDTYGTRTAFRLGALGPSVRRVRALRRRAQRVRYRIVHGTRGRNDD